MKKMYSNIAAILLCSLFLLSACSKKEGEEEISPASVDKQITLNSNTNTSAAETLYVKRDRSSAVIQVTGITTTSIDLKRLYVYKKEISSSNIGSYITYQGSGFKQDANDQWYYDIPNDQKNNATLTLTVPLKAGNNAAVSDEYYFSFTSAAAFGNPSSPANVLLGPAQIYIAYGLLTETTGHRLNNMMGPNSGAFDLVNLTNKAASDPATGKDMLDSDASTALWDKSFTGGTSGTTYVKASGVFDYANATDVTAKLAFLGGGSATTITGVSTGDVYIADLRGLGTTYVVIKVSSISNESGTTGSGNNNEYMEFSVKK